MNSVSSSDMAGAAAGGLRDDTTTVVQLRQMMARFVAERAWEPYHDPKNLAMSIAVEAAELMEHFQWLRSEDLPAISQQEPLRAEIADELADVVCFVLSFANALSIDISAAVAAKLVKNAAKYPAEQFRGRYEKPRR